MKNIISAILVLAVGILLFGCAGNSQTNHTQNQTQNYTVNNTNHTVTQNNTVNNTQPKVTFSITNCTAVAYDSDPGTEDWAAGLNCSYITNRACRNIFDDSVKITIFGPDGKKIGNDYSVCGNGSKTIEMAPSWTTPAKGTYTLKSAFYTTGEPLQEYNITFSGQKLAVIPVLSLPGPLKASIFKGEYLCYDSDLNYVGFKLNNSGDLPVFTDSVSATIDGKSASLSPKYIMLAPGKTTSGQTQLCWNSLSGGLHTLVVKTFNEGNRISEDTMNFNIPSLEVVR